MTVTAHPFPLSASGHGFMLTTKDTKDTKNGDYHNLGSSFVSFVSFVVEKKLV